MPKSSGRGLRTHNSDVSESYENTGEGTSGSNLGVIMWQRLE